MTKYNTNEISINNITLNDISYGNNLQNILLLSADNTNITPEKFIIKIDGFTANNTTCIENNLVLTNIF